MLCHTSAHISTGTFNSIDQAVYLPSASRTAWRDATLNSSEPQKRILNASAGWLVGRVLNGRSDETGELLNRVIADALLRAVEQPPSMYRENMGRSSE
jgi:hypothetical protein